MMREPEWQFQRATERFIWLRDGDRPVLLLDEQTGDYELRCHGQDGHCPPAIVPKYYHLSEYCGIRVQNRWRYEGERISCWLETRVEEGVPVLEWHERWSDGSRGRHVGRVRLDAKWGAYVVEETAELRARRTRTRTEFCNLLPAHISDSRPGRSRFPHTVWAHPDGLRKMGKNPLWFNSAGAQDAEGRRRIRPGGFLGFGPDEHLNPVMEIIESTPPVGACTCDNLQDEHIVLCPPEGRQAEPTGWFGLQCRYRIFSVPEPIMERAVERAQDLEHGPMLAWKFQYPAIPELPDDLQGVQLPGSPFYGRSDFSEPVSWDRPFAGRLWTASPCPEADIHYDRSEGPDRPGSIRMRVEGDDKTFAPRTGHTLWTDECHTYRLSAWIKTQGDCEGWVSALETRFRHGDVASHESRRVGPDSDWKRVETEYTARGEEAPFADTVLHAEGQGCVWFADLAFEDMTEV